MTGIPVLQAQFASLFLVVEIAWGSGPTGTVGTWTDISADLDAAVNITCGRPDEAGTTGPATCTLLLKNPGGRYSKGPQSPSWPNVRKNTPVRVRVIYNGTSYTRFYGYVSSFIPTTDDVDAHPQAVVSAAGTLRRLSSPNRVQPLRSVFYRTYGLGYSTVALRPKAYWPCEDGVNSTQISSGLAGGAPMAVAGQPTYAQNSSFPCSEQLPLLSGSAWTGSIPAHTGGGANVLRFLLSIPAGGAPNGAVLARMYTAAAVARVDLKYGTASAGQLAVVGYNAAGVQLFASAFTSPAIGGYVGGFNNLPVFVSVELATSGSAVTYQVLYEPLVAIAGSFGTAFLLASGSQASSTLGNATTVVINPDQVVLDTAVGHVIYQAAFDPLANTSFQLNAWPGESATDRLTRICTEQGDSIALTSGTTLMGTQLLDTYIKMLRGCELADGGILFDGFGPGLSYVPALARMNLTATLTLDAASGDPTGPIKPVDDELPLVNSFTASRPNGSSVTFADTTSPNSVPNIGEYPGSDTVNLYSDAALADYAAWRVHLGTVDTYRYPSLSIRLHQATRILQGWLNTTIASRIDLLNLSKVNSGTDPRPINLIAEGWNESIDQFEWFAQINTSPYGPWRVARLAIDASDRDEGILRLESDGSTNTGQAAVGAVTLSVTTPSGPLWTTDPAECPIELDIGGIHVTATAISGASSPQTFTVSPVTMKIPDGAAVTIWNPAYLGR